MHSVLIAASGDGIVSRLTDWLVDTSSAQWFLVLIFVIALLDSVIPIVPSETTVIIGGVAAGAGDQNLLLVIVAGAIGAFIGDNLAYLIGRSFHGPIARRAERKSSTQRRLNWAAEQVRDRGGLLLVTARFIPGGRTALTISCGLTQQPRRWFVKWVALAVTIWATYAAVLGAIFGRALQDNHTAAFLIAFFTALAINIIIELVRKRRSKAHL
ncbi:MAG: DedA family protein [Ilumatobacteraceae bacterium]|nr:DedA family protein [Ilumatobacteraceae bacterium]